MLRCGCVSGRVSIKLIYQSKVISEKTFPTKIFWVKSILCKKLLIGHSLDTFSKIFNFPQNLRPYFSNFHPLFRNIVVSKEDIGTLMKESAEKGKINFRPRGMLITSFHVTNGKLTTPLQLFTWSLGWCARKFVGPFNAIPKNVSTLSYRLPRLHDVKELKIRTQKLWLNFETAS